MEAKTSAYRPPAGLTSYSGFLYNVAALEFIIICLCLFAFEFWRNYRIRNNVLKSSPEGTKTSTWQWVLTPIHSLAAFASNLLLNNPLLWMQLFFRNGVT